MYRTSKPNCYWSFHNKICTCKFSKRLNLYSKRFELKFILLFSLLHCFWVRISTIAHPTTFLFPIHKRNCTCEVDITCLQLFKKKPCLFPILKARDWRELKNGNVDKVLGTLEYKKIFFSGLTYPKQCWIFQNFELFKKKNLFGFDKNDTRTTSTDIFLESSLWNLSKFLPRKFFLHLISSSFLLILSSSSNTTISIFLMRVNELRNFGSNSIISLCADLMLLTFPLMLFLASSCLLTKYFNRSTREIIRSLYLKKPEMFPWIFLIVFDER